MLTKEQKDELRKTAWNMGSQYKTEFEKRLEIAKNPGIIKLLNDEEYFFDVIIPLLLEHTQDSFRQIKENERLIK